MIGLVPVELIEGLAAAKKPDVPKQTAEKPARKFKVTTGKIAVKRCRAYPAKVPGGVEGDHGSDQTFKAADCVERLQLISATVTRCFRSGIRVRPAVA